MTRRGMLWLMVALTGCGGATHDGPLTLAEVSPGAVQAGEVISVAGTGFEALVSIRFGGAPSEIQDDFAAWLGSTALGSVTRISSTELQAVVPTGIPPGTYDLRVRDPAGREALLPQAVEVLACAPVPGADCKTPVAVSERGEARLDGTRSSTTVTFSEAIDPAHHALWFNYTHAGLQPSSGLVMGELRADGTGIELSRSSAGGVEVDVSWWLWGSPALSVQRGRLLFNDLPAPAVVTLERPVDPSRAIALVSWRNTGLTYDTNDWVMATLTGPDTLELDLASLCCNGAIAWQVVELPADEGAVVQHGVAELPLGTPELAVTLPHRAPPGRSFLLFSQAVRTVQGESAASVLVRGWLSNARQIRLARQESNAALSVSWSVVTWPALRVTRGEQVFSPGQTEATVALPSPVDPLIAGSFLPALQRQGSADPTHNGQVGAGWFTSRLVNNGASLLLQRGTGSGAARARWVVVETR